MEGFVPARASSVLVKRLVVPGLLADLDRRVAVGDCGIRMKSGSENS